jgi:nucleoside-diphosphate-sugar epimerase
MSLYLVTGGAGFIGSNIVETLLKRGVRVRVVDNFATGKRENIQPFLDRVDFHEIDICDLESLQKAMEGVDYVIHQAAIPSVPKSIIDPIASHHADITGTLTVLWAAQQTGVKRVVYAASSSAYGESERLPKEESMLPLPISPYGLMKYVGEEYCRIFTLIYGLETVALRYFNVFGPRQDPSSPYSGVLSRFISVMLQGGCPTIYGDGEQTRDFTFVDNVVEANWLACHAEGVAGQVFNIACGRRISLNQIVGLLNGMLGLELSSYYEPARTGDIKHSLADISMARKKLNYRPEVSFEEGLQRTVVWYREYQQRIQRQK